MGNHVIIKLVLIWAAVSHRPTRTQSRKTRRSHSQVCGWRNLLLWNWSINSKQEMLHLLHFYSLVSKLNTFSVLAQTEMCHTVSKIVPLFQQLFYFPIKDYFKNNIKSRCWDKHFTFENFCCVPYASVSRKLCNVTLEDVLS